MNEWVHHAQIASFVLVVLAGFCLLLLAVLWLLDCALKALCGTAEVYWDFIAFALARRGARRAKRMGGRP